MRSFRAAWVGLAVVLAACHPPPARPQAEILPPVVARWKEATGGDAWDALRSVHVVSSVERGGLRGSAEEWDDTQSGRFCVHEEVGPLASTDGFDGRDVWTEDESRRAWIVGDRNSREAALNTAFRIANGYWSPGKRGARIEQGRGDGAHDVVLITPPNSRTFEIWLDASTHLPARVVDNGDSGVSVVTFGDYRHVGRFVMPFLIRQGDGEAVDREARIVRYDLDATIPEGRFRLPQHPLDDVHLPAGKTATQIPLRLDDDELLIPVFINGKGPYEAILDTGGAASFTPEIASEVGITSVGAMQGVGAGGSFRQSYGHAESLRVGEVTLDNVLFAVRPNASAPRQIVVGHELFQRLTIAVDFEHSVVTLTRPEAFAPAGRAIALPFRFLERMPMVDAKVEGFAGEFCVDTGQNAPLELNYPFAAEHHFFDRLKAQIPIGAVGAGGLRNEALRMSRVPEVGVAGLVAHDVRIIVATESSKGESQSRYLAGCLGTGFLKRFTTTFDYARARILLEPNVAFGTPDRYTRTGLLLTRDGESWKVRFVLERSPAADAGLTAGMTVTSVEGKHANAMAFEELRALMSGPVGARISIGIRDGATERTVIMTLRDLL